MLASQLNGVVRLSWADAVDAHWLASFSSEPLCLVTYRHPLPLEGILTTLAAAAWQCLLNLSRLTPEFLHLRARRVLLIGGKPEVIFDSIDTVYQLGADY